MKTLIHIDDDAVYRLIVQKTLKGIVHVESFVSGEAFLADRTQKDIGAFLLDIHLGPDRMNGEEFVDKLHKENAYSHLPVIALSSTACSSSRQSFLYSIGFSEVICKPFQKEAFIQAIRKAVTQD
jgi:CheY-like chemotaxis protein